jgi:5-methylcytosine-specific restriction endonuclease McrA
MSTFVFIILIAIGLYIFLGKYNYKIRRQNRREYYNEEYLKSDAWKRKRYVVFKRDNWTCVYCGKPATQVHHKKYAKINIGREPIEWLESVCSDCHNERHRY